MYSEGGCFSTSSLALADMLTRWGGKQERGSNYLGERMAKRQGHWLFIKPAVCGTMAIEGNLATRSAHVLALVVAAFPLPTQIGSLWRWRRDERAWPAARGSPSLDHHALRTCRVAGRGGAGSDAATPCYTPGCIGTEGNEGLRDVVERAGMHFPFPISNLGTCTSSPAN